MENPKENLLKLGLAPSKKRGQNFLRDPRQIEKIADIIREKSLEAKALLEIGPGLGALTARLLSLGKKMWAVEFDRGLAENLKPLEGPDFAILSQDVLTLDLGPLVLEAQGPLFVCGNLPYNISSPILFWLLKAIDQVDGAVFMLQKEMAERLTAPVGTKSYGRLTVALSLFFHLEKIIDIPPSAFHPRPKIFSSIIHLKPKKEKPAIEPNLLGRFTALCFAARRKTVMNNLGPALGREKTIKALESLGLSPNQRPETISPTQLAGLARLLMG